MNRHFDYQANLMNAQQLTMLEMKTCILYSNNFDGDIEKFVIFVS